MSLVRLFVVWIQICFVKKDSFYSIHKCVRYQKLELRKIQSFQPELTRLYAIRNIYKHYCNIIHVFQGISSQISKPMRRPQIYPMPMTIQGPDRIPGPMLGPMPVLMPGPIPSPNPVPIAGPMPEPIAGLMQDPLPRTFHIRVPLSPQSLISFPHRRMQMPYVKPPIIRVTKLEDELPKDNIQRFRFVLVPCSLQERPFTLKCLIQSFLFRHFSKFFV